jgi:hypothetical protein
MTLAKDPTEPIPDVQTGQEPQVFIAPTVTERARLAKTLRKTPVGAIRSGLQNRLIQILEYDAGLRYRAVSSIRGQPAGPLGESENAPQDLRPEDCVMNLYTGEPRP